MLGQPDGVAALRTLYAHIDAMMWPAYGSETSLHRQIAPLVVTCVAFNLLCAAAVISAILQSPEAAPECPLTDCPEFMACARKISAEDRRAVPVERRQPQACTRLLRVRFKVLHRR